MKIEIKLIPDGLDPAKEIQDGIPVDKMVNGGGDDGSCPVATQDVETNEENRGGGLLSASEVHVCRRQLVRGIRRRRTHY